MKPGTALAAKVCAGPLAVAAWIFLLPVSQAAAQASPALDTSIYRPGEVSRVTGNRADWTYICDIVVRLNQRFCSLFTTAAPEGSAEPISVTVSTSENGRPAAMASFPLMVALKDGVKLHILDKAGKAAKQRKAQLQVPFSGCDRKSCYLAWELSPGQIGALREGRSIRISYGYVPNGIEAEKLLSGFDPETASIAISGKGFAEALAATSEPLDQGAAQEGVK